LDLWALTDRGPNGTRKTSDGKRRTLLFPTFTPTIVRMTLDSIEPDSPSPGETVRITATKPLVGRSGRPLSGRPNGIGKDEPILDENSGTEVAPDPNGVDTEGLVRLRDGTFWLAEEYRPSLLEVADDGAVVGRYVPKGNDIPGADMSVHEVLPAAYGSRRDNRGFEALALSPDESRLWALLQSPLDHPDSKDGRKTGNVRLLAFDTRTKTPVAEYLYRLGNPDDPDYLIAGAPPADGKLCAMAAIGATTLVVLEQSEEGVARLYTCSFADATDTLSRNATPGDTEPVLEQVRDLRAAGITPVRKTLLADLAPLLPAMRDDAYGADPKADANDRRELKIEGLAILDHRRIVLVNDNDFGVGVPPTAAPPRTCLWVLQVPSVRPPQQ
jgi:hypothetical protein